MVNSKLKISLIGGSGFIGQAICNKLRKEKIEFEILDIVPPNNYENCYRYCDVRNIDSLRASVCGNVLVVLAAIHSDNASLQDYLATNVDGAKNIVKITEELDVDKIIFTSSVAVYAISESAVDENSQIKPFNNYGKSKLDAENIFRAWAAFDKRYLSIIRPTAVFGEKNRGNIYNLFAQIFAKRFIMIGDGKNKKSVAYVENVAGYIVQHIKFPISLSISNYADTPNISIEDMSNQISYILHSKKLTKLRIPRWLGMTLAIILDLLSKIINKKFKISRIRIKKFCANSVYISQTDERLRYQAEYSLEQALKRTLISEFKS